MSDPRYTDPRLNDPREPVRRDQRLGELEESNAMWGWIAGGVVLALLLLFVFGRAPDTTNTTSTDNGIPPASTTLAPPRNPAPPVNAEAPRPAPSTTTGQASSPPANPPATTGQSTPQ